MERSAYWHNKLLAINRGAHVPIPLLSDASHVSRLTSLPYLDTDMKLGTFAVADIRISPRFYGSHGKGTHDEISDVCLFFAST